MDNTIQKLMEQSYLLKKQMSEKLEHGYKELDNIEDTKVREFLRKSMKDALSNKLDVNQFMQSVNKMKK